MILECLLIKEKRSPLFDIEIFTHTKINGDYLSKSILNAYHRFDENYNQLQYVHQQFYFCVYLIRILFTPENINKIFDSHYHFDTRARRRGKYWNEKWINDSQGFTRRSNFPQSCFITTCVWKQFTTKRLKYEILQ